MPKSAARADIAFNREKEGVYGLKKETTPSHAWLLAKSTEERQLQHSELKPIRLLFDEPSAKEMVDQSMISWSLNGSS